MTPKEALIKDGTVPTKEGRGRLSRAQNDRCLELAASGWNIKGYEVSNVPKSTEKVVNKVKVVNNGKVIDDYVIFYDREEFKAVDKAGKEWGMPEVCNNCMVSLVQCHCGKPTILNGIALTIKRR